MLKLLKKTISKQVHLNLFENSGFLLTIGMMIGKPHEVPIRIVPSTNRKLELHFLLLPIVGQFE